MSDKPTDEEVTPAQLAANRANAQLSKGPRTEEGKRRSAMNALKTGMTAKTVVLPDEDADEFMAFREEILRALDPQGALEEALAETLSVDLWRARRGARVEASLHAHAMRQLEEENTIAVDYREVIQVLERVRSDEDNAAAAVRAAEARDAAGDDATRIGLSFHRVSDPLLKHARYEETIHRRIWRNLHELERRKAARAGTVIPPPQTVDILADVSVEHELGS